MSNCCSNQVWLDLLKIFDACVWCMKSKAIGEVELDAIP